MADELGDVWCGDYTVPPYRTNTTWRNITSPIRPNQLIDQLIYAAHLQRRGGQKDRPECIYAP